MDKRQIKTRKAIFKAMAELMKTMSYDKIFVKDIIDVAEIGRSTFYAHFETKEDLAEAMCFDLFDHVFAAHVIACQTHNYTMKPPTLEHKIAHIFYHLRDKQDYYKGFLVYEEGRLFVKFFKKYIEERLDMIIVKEHVVPMPKDFFVNHLSFALIGAVQWWIRGRMKMEPEKMAQYFAATINPADIEFKPKDEPADE